MGNYISAGVYSQEKDLSTIVPAIATSSAAIVGYSVKGPTDATLITNSQQFISKYGEPVLNNYFHYSALAFLENGNILYCKRVINGALYAGISIVNEDSSDDNAGFAVGQSAADFYDDSTVSDEIFSIFAENQGLWGNNIKIIIKDVNNLYYDEDDEHACEVADQYTFVIEVYYPDNDGNYSLVESWKVSRKTKTDGYNKQVYLEDVINGYSSYIRVADNTDVADTVLPKENASTYIQATGGVNGSEATASQIAAAWSDFENPSDIDVRILIAGGYTTATVASAIVAIAEARKDCIAVLDTSYSNLASAQTITDWRRDDLNINSSYAALYAPWVKINDPYNDKVVTVPPSGFVASQYAYNDSVEEAWWAPAGFNRGLLNVLALSDIFTKGERDTLYKYQVNPLQTFRGQGNVIWGQKTLQVKPSALDRVNVRRLLIVLEKEVSTSLQTFLFEPNSELTRFRITAMLDEYMDNLSAKGAFQTELGDKGYLNVCSTTNNTPAVIDRNELHVDIFVKPIRSAEFIQLQTIITTTGVSFNELITKGVLF